MLLLVVLSVVWRKIKPAGMFAVAAIIVLELLRRDFFAYIILLVPGRMRHPWRGHPHHRMLARRSCYYRLSRRPFCVVTDFAGSWHC